MKLRSLTVHQFKKFADPVRLDGIEDGLNVVVGPNEMGKSTLLDALRAALFERHNSSAQPIRALQNVRNQAAPVVELAFELEDGVYRIRKRFLKKAYAQLDCPDGRRLEGDAAEEALRELLNFTEPGKQGAKPETLGMWNVLWVQQGQSFGALEIPDAARSNLHNALEAEVGRVLGGSRGQKLPQRIEQQLSEFVTPSTNRPKGDYKVQIERQSALEKELEELRRRRTDLSRALEELEDAQEKLTRLSSGEQDKADKEELAAARKRQTQLAELEARIEAAESELELRKGKLEQAQRILSERGQLKEKIDLEQQALQQSQKSLEDAQAQEEQARKKLEGLRAAIRSAEQAVAKADDGVTGNRRLLTAVGYKEQIADLDKRLEKAQQAEARQREAQQAAAAILVTDEVIEAIREAAKDLDTMEGRLSAAATRISFDMSPECLSRIDVQGVERAPEQTTIEVVEPASLSIPDYGRVSIEPAIKDRDTLLQDQRDSRKALQKFLEEAGAKSLKDAEDQYHRRQSLLQNAELARQEVELNAPAEDEREAGAQALADRVAGLKQRLQRQLEDLDLEKLPDRKETEEALRQAEEQAVSAREELETVRAGLAGPEEVLNWAQSELGAAKSRCNESRERLEGLHKQLKEAEEARSVEALQADVQTVRNEIARQEEVLEELKGQRTEETLPQLEARIERLEKALQERREKREAVKVQISGLKSRVEAAEGVGLDEEIEKKAREHELCEADVSRMKREVDVLSRLLKTLRDAEQEAKERYLSPVLNRVRPYLQLLFPGADIRIDENLRITEVVRAEGYEEAFHDLSMGTQEQIAILVRLAFAEMLTEQGQPATVILDDALVFSDDSRIGRMFDILNHAARNTQILILTCRERLFEELGGQSLSLEAVDNEELMSA